MNDDNDFEINENMNNLITEEDNKQLKDTTNQRNNIINDPNHGKEVLENLIHKNDKFKDVYLMMFPGGLKKKENKKKALLNLNVDLNFSKRNYKKSNPTFKNKKLLNFYNEMKSFDGKERAKSYGKTKFKDFAENVKLKNNLYNNTKNEFKKNGSTNQISFKTNNNNNTNSKIFFSPFNINSFENGLLSLNKFNNLNERKFFNDNNLNDKGIKYWITKEKINQTNYNFYDKKSSEITNLMLKGNIINSPNHLNTKNNVIDNHISETRRLYKNELSNFSKQLNNINKGELSSKNSSRIKFFK